MGAEQHRTALELPAEPASVRLARRWVNELLGRLDASPQCAADAELVVSELVANVLVHTSSAVGLSAVVTGRTVRVAVHDDDAAQLPAVRAQDPTRPGGFGLLLVERLAGQWGFDLTGSGKDTWFEVEV